jgi:hypothetical protein
MTDIRIEHRLADDPRQAETVITVIGARAFALKPEPAAER